MGAVLPTSIISLGAFDFSLSSIVPIVVSVAKFNCPCISIFKYTGLIAILGETESPPSIN